MAVIQTETGKMTVKESFEDLKLIIQKDELVELTQKYFSLNEGKDKERRICINTNRVVSFSED